MPRLAFILLFLGGFVTHVRAACEEWCTAPCEELNGNFNEECSDCRRSEFACRVGTNGHVSTHDPAEMEVDSVTDNTMKASILPTSQQDPRTSSLISDGEPQVSLGFVPIEESAELSAREPLACQRVSADEVRQLTLEQRAQLLSQPTLVTGAMDDWTAMRDWTRPADFAQLFPEYGVLAKRVGPVGEALMAAGRDPATTLVPLAYAANLTARIHVVLYPGEPGNAILEEDFLLDLLESRGTAWKCPSGIISRACGTPVCIRRAPDARAMDCAPARAHAPAHARAHTRAHARARCSVWEAARACAWLTMVSRGWGSLRG